MAELTITGWTNCGDGRRPGRGGGLVMVAALCTVLLSACSNGAKNQQVAAAAAARDAEWKSPPPYILRPGDEIEVKFFYVPTMNEREFIREDGKLVLPLLNTPMKVSGLSVEELHNRLIAAYSDTLKDLKDGDIEVLLRTEGSARVFVAGQVTQQNAVALVGPTTVSQAIAMAQGVKPSAYASQVLIIRRFPDGRTITREVDYNKIVKGNDRADDIQLAAGDIVYVPQKFISRVDDVVAQFRDALPISSSFGLSWTLGNSNGVNFP